MIAVFTGKLGPNFDCSDFSRLPYNCHNKAPKLFAVYNHVT